MKKILASFTLMALAASVANAADGTWTNDGSSTWSTTGNWADGIVADGAGSGRAISRSIKCSWPTIMIR